MFKKVVSKFLICFSLFTSNYANTDFAKQKLATDLFDIGAVKFGEFKLKSGMMSPIYIDLRLTISNPGLLKQVALEMWKKIEDKKFDLVCGIPMAGIPFATTLSVMKNMSLIMLRPQVKDYGTRKAIEGIFNKNQTCLVVDDLVSTGESKIESIEKLEKEGLVVKDIVVLINRNQGGNSNLEKAGYRLHSVFEMDEFLNLLLKANKISQEQMNMLLKYVEVNKA